MSQSALYPRASVAARFRRPTTLDLPTSEQEADALRIRVEWDHPVHVDEFLEVTLSPREMSDIRCVARVARVDTIVWKDPTRYEVFLELFALSDEDRATIDDTLVVETAAPDPASRSLIAAPIPDEPPETTATLPLRSTCMATPLILRYRPGLGANARSSSHPSG